MVVLSLKFLFDEVERIHEWDTKKLAGTAKECYNSNFTVEYRNN